MKRPLQEEEWGREHFSFSLQLAWQWPFHSQLHWPKSVSSKETRVQCLFWEIQMGVKWRRGEIRFHGFELFLSRCCFPPVTQIISPVSKLRHSSASCSKAGSFTPWASCSLRDMAGKPVVRSCSCQGRLNHVLHTSFHWVIRLLCPTATSSFSSSWPSHNWNLAGFLPWLLWTTETALTSSISSNPPLSFFTQDRRFIKSRYFPLLALLKGCPGNPISSRTFFNSLKGCIQIASAM